jgi:hypothetical protein
MARSTTSRKSDQVVATASDNRVPPLEHEPTRVAAVDPLWIDTLSPGSDHTQALIGIESVGMDKCQLRFFLIAVAPGMTLWLVGGVAHLAAPAAAPVPAIVAEPLSAAELPRLQANAGQIAAPPTVLEPASLAERATVVAAAVPLAAPAASDAALPEPRAVEVAMPVPQSKLATPERSLQPTGRPPAVPTPGRAPVARVPQSKERPSSHKESGANNFAAVAAEDAPSTGMKLNGVRGR